MNPFILTLVVPLILIASNRNQPVWKELGEMVHPRGEHASAVVNGEIYVFGGIHDHRFGPPFIEKYNPKDDQWTSLGVWNNPKHHITAGTSVWKDEIWLCGGKWGNDEGGVRTVDIYNVKSNSWRKGPALPEIHWGGPAVIVDHYIHVFTGAVSKDVSSDHHFVLDLENELAGWTSKAPVPEPRVHIAGAAVSGKIYLLGGEYHHIHDGDTRTIQVYDPMTDSWDLTKSEMPIPRSHHEWSTFAYGDKIISVSGVDSANDEERGQSEILVYDTISDEWSIWNDLPFDMSSAGAKAINNQLYVFGGGFDDWLPVHGKTFVTSINLDEQ
ncbi:MAG: hypothetical protein CMJ19_16405 [Phycisphaeraceae bacterium]|nr:hypothetical protein [Phycisphaeraceae bacterium]